MEKINKHLWKTDTGKVFKNKNNGDVYGELLLLGINDRIENYEEIEKPMEE